MVRISVVITCYNLERYIGDAIESVLTQDIGEPFELIVVDDSSTDQSRAIATRFPATRLFKTDENCGVLLAMLHGLKEANGEYIFLLDGDDRWCPDKLRRCVAAFDTNPAMIFTTHDLRFINAQGAVIERSSRVSHVLGAIDPATRSETIRRGILQMSDYVWLGSAIGFRRSLADVEGFVAFVHALPDPRNTYQDWPLAMWLATRSANHSFGYVSKQMFEYRLHGANYSGDARTLDRARRNFRRARNTTAAVLALARIGKNRAALERRLALNEMQLALYEDRRVAAMCSYIHALPLLVTSGLLRETARFAIGITLGAERLVRTSGWTRR